jgi:hypothetical protein
MNWRQKIITDWPNDPQRSHKAKEALKQIEESLLILASLGHPLHVEEGYTPPPPPEWPKAVFHMLQGTRVVACQADLDELGDDWYGTMEEARHAAGVIKQNQRGGIFSRALPSILRRGRDDEEAEQEVARLAREAQKRFIQEQRAIHRSRGLADLPDGKRNARQI